VVGVGLGGVAIQVLAEGLELGVVGQGEGIGFVLFAGQVRVPGRQAGAAGDPQALHRGGVHVVVLDHAERAGGGVLVQRDHRDRRGQLAVGGGAGLVARGVLELHHGKHRVALDPRHLGFGQGQQRGAIGAVRVEMALAPGHRAVQDGLVADVVVAAGQHLTALTVGQHLACHEKGLVGQGLGALAAIGQGHAQGRLHRGAGHGLGVGQRGRRHAFKTHRAKGRGARCRGAGATCQPPQGEQGRGGQGTQHMTTRRAGNISRHGKTFQEHGGMKTHHRSTADEQPRRSRPA